MSYLILFQLIRRGNKHVGGYLLQELNGYEQIVYIGWAWHVVYVVEENINK